MKGRTALLDQNLEKKLLKIQRKEITEHVVYAALAEKSKGRNAEILRGISDDELRHYKIWRELTQKDVQPNRLSILKYLILSRLFGVVFVMKIMEGNEAKAQQTYIEVSRDLDEAKRILQDEIAHENSAVEMIDEERLNYVSSTIQGLNDALIELAGELAGFTFAFQNTVLIGFAGLIAGIAQFLSSSASELEIYLSQRTEENKEKLKTSLFEGLIYLITVFFLVTPFFLVDNYYFALGVTAINSFLIIAFFTYYVSVVKGLSIKKMFLTIVLITVSLGALAFVIGWIVTVVLGL